MLGKWRVVVSNPAIIDEIRKSPDDLMSFKKSTAEVSNLP